MSHKTTSSTKQSAVVALESFDALPDSAQVRLPTVCRLYGVGSASIWRWSKAGAIPAPIKISERVTAWNVGALRADLRRRGI